MESKRQAIRRALKGDRLEIPPPKFIVVSAPGEGDEEIDRIIKPKIKAATKEYYKNYKMGDERLPI